MSENRTFPDSVSGHADSRREDAPHAIMLIAKSASTAAVSTNKPNLQFKSIFFHDLVSPYFGGHLMPENAALQKVRRN